MKKRALYFVAAIATIVTLGGCNNFLKEVDQDKFSPTTTDHYASLMLKEFNYNYTPFLNTQYMSDEIDTYANQGLSSSILPSFTWQRDIELDMGNFSRLSLSGTWLLLYRNIAICNYVIEDTDKASGTPEESAYVKGEAYFIRAYCYFTLTNLYAEPYRNATQASETLGVPLRTDIGVEATYDKATLAESYNLILSDLTEARRLIAQSGLNKGLYHPSTAACDVMLSRVQLFMNNYDAVIASLQSVLANAVITRFKILGVDEKIPSIMTESSGEVLYGFGVGTTGNGGLTVSNYLLDLYDENDLRPSYWFGKVKNSSTGDIYWVNYKYSGNKFSTVGQCMLRLPEAYLNRAEAYARKGSIALAVADVRKVAEVRHKAGVTVEIPTDKASLLKFIYEERFREFCFEEHFRWFDLRRMPESERREITHVFQNMNNLTLMGTRTYVLLTDDPNYTLSVPFTEKTNNPLIYDYERFDKLPIK